MDFLLLLPGMIISITVHEFAKALVSTRLGDPAPRNNGRLTLNPLKHIEPIGLLFMFIFRFGWGKPTPTSATYYKDRKNGILLTYITPSVVNIFIGILFGMIAYYFKHNMIVLSAVPIQSSAGILFNFYAHEISYLIAYFNISLALFNIIPIYPLDGAKILNLYLNPNDLIRVTNYEKVLQIFLVIMLATNLVGMMINPFVDMILKFAK